jgi:hypothetical protein
MPPLPTSEECVTRSRPHWHSEKDQIEEELAAVKRCLSKPIHFSGQVAAPVHTLSRHPRMRNIPAPARLAAPPRERGGALAARTADTGERLPSSICQPYGLGDVWGCPP